MRALSIRQPWAWLIVNGFKDIENRDWPTNIRGRFLVHAGKTIDADGERWIRHNFPQIDLPCGFQCGGIVGEVRIADCVQDSDSPWFMGDYGFVLRDAKALPFQPCRGKLGFFVPELETQRTTEDGR